MDVPQASMLQLILHPELALSPNKLEEAGNGYTLAGDANMHDGAEAHLGSDVNQGTLLPQIALHREPSLDMIKIEDVSDIEDQNNESEDDSDEEFLPEDPNLYEGNGPSAEYIRKGMLELYSWMHGKIYDPKKKEAQWILLDSPQKFRGCRDAYNKVVDDLRQALSSLPCHPEHDRILRILNDAEFDDTVTVERIGLQGPAGAGKSSLTNALLNIPGLALTDCGMVACTQFPIEYAAPRPGQTQRFVIEIQFYDEDARMKLLREQLAKYREETVQPGNEDTLDNEQDPKRRKEAIDFFIALFVGQAPFQSREAMHEFLNQPNMEVICTTMQQYLQELLQDEGIYQDNICFGATTPKELNELLMPYIGSLDTLGTSNDQAVLWPIVASMRVLVASPILESGIVLVDAPGVNDSNGYRVKVAQASLKSCGHVVVVIDGNRAQANNIAENYIETVARRRDPKMIIAVTHSDKTSECHAIKSALLIDATARDIDQSVATITAKHDRLKKTLKKQRMKLLAETQDFQMKSKLLEGVRTGRRMELAAPRAEQNMLETYKETLSNRSVELHNVSNEMYLHLASKYNLNVPTPPPIEFTGIPKLRRSIREIGEELQIRQLEDHIGSILSNALTSILLWCDPSKVDISSTAQPAIQSCMDNCTAILQRNLDDLHRMAFKHITCTIKNNMDQWMVESIHTLGPYLSGNVVGVTTVNALINKHGLHVPSGKDLVDLNANYMDFMCQKLIVAFQCFEAAVIANNEKAKDDLLSSCDDLIQKLEQDQAKLVFDQKKHVFEAKRKAIRDAISTVFKSAARAFSGQLRYLRSFAMETEYESAIMQVLRPIYELIKAKHPRQKGYCRLRQAAFRKYIESDQSYTEYLEKVEDESQFALDSFHYINIKTKCDTILGDLQQTLSEYCVLPQASAEALASRKEMGKVVEANLRLLTGEISQKFRESLCVSRREAYDIRMLMTGKKRKRFEASQSTQ